MYELLHALFPYVIVLYLLDCLTYVRRGKLLFTAEFGERFTVRRGGFSLIGLLPTSKVIACQIDSLLLTTRGCYSLNRALLSHENGVYEEANLNFVEYEDISSISAHGPTVLVGGNTVFTAVSSARADRMADVLRKLQRTRHSKRSEIIKDCLMRSMDTESISTTSLDDWSFSLVKQLGWILLVCVFLLWPLILLLDKSELAASVGLTVNVNYGVWAYLTFLTYAGIMIASVLAARKLAPLNSRQLGPLVLPRLLLPVAAIHMLRELTKDMYSGLDYLAVAALLLPPSAFRSLARVELKRVMRASAAAVAPDLKEFWELRERAVSALLERKALNQAELVRTLVQRDPSAASYCPGCLAQYRPGFSVCSDCEDEELREF